MAHFRGVLRNPNQKSDTSKTGSKNSGLTAHCDGWDCGVTVEAHHDAVTGDYFEIFATDGSGYKGIKTPIATVREAAHGIAIDIIDTN